MARKKWCRQEDLNPQPTDYKSVALPIELHRRAISDLNSRWWRMTGSNRRPPACKAGALPAELTARPGPVYRRPSCSEERERTPETERGSRSLERGDDVVQERLDGRGEDAQGDNDGDHDDAEDDGVLGHRLAGLVGAAKKRKNGHGGLRSSGVVPRPGGGRVPR